MPDSDTTGYNLNGSGIVIGCTGRAASMARDHVERFPDKDV